ncbi:hypothetical protein Tco_0890647 [Tanacetum coccineum]|uniref:Uncharacterized protein n=1 Tax=Tanacetum coccineum TaxID=301880 RepID=A0ABQ5C0N4_9ASTR
MAVKGLFYECSPSMKKKEEGQCLLVGGVFGLEAKDSRDEVGEGFGGSVWLQVLWILFGALMEDESLEVMVDGDSLFLHAVIFDHEPLSLSLLFLAIL